MSGNGPSSVPACTPAPPWNTGRRKAETAASICKQLAHTIANQNAFADHAIDYQSGQLFLSERPVLGLDFDVARREACLVHRRSRSYVPLPRSTTPVDGTEVNGRMVT